MSELSENAVQVLSDTHKLGDGAGAATSPVETTAMMPRPSTTESTVHQPDHHDGAGAANPIVEPDVAPPRQSKRSRHSANDDRRRDAAAGPADGAAQPKQPMPDTPKRGRHRSDDAQKAATAARRSKEPLQPNGGLSGDNSEGHAEFDAQYSGALDGRAIQDLKSKDDAPGHPSSDGQLRSDNHSFAAVAGDDPVLCDTQLAPVIATIRELWRRRQAWHRAEKSLTLQAKAICRRYVGGDKDEADKLFATVEGHTSSDTQMKSAPITVAILPLMMARETISKHRLAVEKELTKLAKILPVYPWCEAIRGFGALSLAALVGECGDIGSYKSASAVWKRMGLAVIEGERQRRVKGVDALEHGYSPERRSVAWNLGTSIMRAQKAGEPYRDFYDTEKEKQLAKELTKGHAHNRACRHMTKRLLANLYGAWRQGAPA